MDNFNSIPLWDTNLFHLSKLCDRGHDYCGTKQSLRFNSRLSKTVTQTSNAKCYCCLLEQFEQDCNNYKYFLHDKCSKGHTFKNTDQSLYRWFSTTNSKRKLKNSYDRICVKCDTEKHQKVYWKSWKAADLELYPVAQNLLSWDAQLYFLGKLCKNNHNYELTNQSLRFLSKIGESCIQCERAKHLELEEKRKRNKERGKLKATFATRQRSLEIKLSNAVKALEYDLELAHTDTVLFAKRLRLRDQNLAYARSAKGKQRDYKRRLLKNISSKTSYNDDDLWKRLVQFDGKCAYCKIFIFNKSHLMTWDHVLPLSKGGKDIIQNLVPCCKSCNSSKCDTEVYVWFKKQPFFCVKSWNKITTHTKQI